jgi:hypothetical protein
MESFFFDDGQLLGKHDPRYVHVDMADASRHASAEKAAHEYFLPCHTKADPLMKAVCAEVRPPPFTH